MEQNRKDQKHAPTQPKKDISSGHKTASRPEVDLPLKGGKSESDMSTRHQPKREERVESDRPSERSNRSTR